ncbi:unnamed protein product [Urochloa humidicola]
MSVFLLVGPHAGLLPLHKLPRPRLQRDRHAGRRPRGVDPGRVPARQGRRRRQPGAARPDAPWFDASGYYASLLRCRGVLHSDQQLFAGGLGVTDPLVRFYAANGEEFRRDFAEAMVRMGSIAPLTGASGEIQYDCRKVNYS